MEFLPIASSLDLLYLCNIKNENNEKLFIMKLKNILSILFFFVVAVSCSVEDDVIDNSSSIIPEGDVAYVSAAISMDNTLTKSTGNSQDGGTIDADPINSYFFFLLDKDNDVVGVHKGRFENPSSSKEEVKFLAKVNVATKIVAFVNYNETNREKLENCMNYDQIKAYKEYNADYRLKIGEEFISWQGVIGSTSTTENLDKASVEIRVKSYTSIVELVEFKVNDQSGRNLDVKLTKVSLSNLKSEGGSVEGSSFQASPKVVKEGNFAPGYYGDKAENFRTNVYPNTDASKPITLNLTFTVTEGGKTTSYDRNYIINRPSDDSFTNNSGHVYVEAGNWYQLTATVNVKSGFVDCNVVCYTNDWIYDSSSEISGDLIKK